MKLTRIWATAAVAAAFVGITALGTSGALATEVPGQATHAEGGTFTLVGLFTLADSTSRLKTGDDCQGQGGYSDIKPGAQVTVYAGDPVATGALGPGTFTAGVGCVFGVVTGDVPRWRGIYQWEVTHRGKLTITEADAVGSVAQATLGN